LRHAGDVSAVIEMPNGFHLFVVKQKTQSALGVAEIFLPKQSFEEWLTRQEE